MIADEKSFVSRNQTIDVIKGLSIISVVLYHLGLLPYGYLGVDVFFVISGFFFVKSLLLSKDKLEFKFFVFLYYKLLRLYPLVLIVAFLSILVGYVGMLPDDYENIGEAVVASTLNSENILECITTSDYWNIVNVFKPLMHLWYVGVLVQNIIVITIVFWLSSIKCVNYKSVFLKCIVILSVLSFIVFLAPCFSVSWKFYYFPFRFYELGIGGIVALTDDKYFLKKITNKCIYASLLVIFLMILLPQSLLASNAFRMIAIVIATTFSLVYCMYNSDVKRHSCWSKLISNIGRMSYSIFIWHQFLIAFMFYSFVTNLNVVSFVIFFIFLSLVSLVSYNFIECNLGNYINKASIVNVCIGLSAIAFINIVLGITVYLRAGVVRDVPELNITIGNFHRGMHAEYVDIPYRWNNGFKNKEKTGVLVIGNSFGRDFANILKESDISDAIEIQYISNTKAVEENRLYLKEFVDNAEKVFVALGPEPNDISLFLDKFIPKSKLYVVGNKKYGASNGIVYTKRFDSDYYESSVVISNVIIKHNLEMRKKYGNHFIDMITPVQNEDGSLRVFTDDNKYISQDTTHLTKAGAQYYAKILDLHFITRKDNMN